MGGLEAGLSLHLLPRRRPFRFRFSERFPSGFHVQAVFYRFEALQVFDGNHGSDGLTPIRQNDPLLSGDGSIEDLSEAVLSNLSGDGFHQRSG